MKRLPLCAALLLAARLPALAQQLPNKGFETWTTTAAGDRAQNWLTTDDLLQATLGIPIATGTVSKTTDAYAGSFAARVETKNVAPFGVFPGYLVLGTRLNLRDGGFGGVPYTGRPMALQLRYKLSGSQAAADSATATVLLTRTVNGQSQPVAEGQLVLPAAATYTLATVPLNYYGAQTPDSVRIVLNSGQATTLTAGTTLLVDELNLTGTTTATRPDAHANCLTLYPNPSADGLFTLDAAHEPALLATPLIVSDLLGRPVLTQAAGPAAPSRVVDLRGQPAGVYTLRLATAQGPIVRRLVIQ